MLQSCQGSVAYRGWVRLQSTRWVLTAVCFGCWLGVAMATGLWASSSYSVHVCSHGVGRLGLVSFEETLIVSLCIFSKMAICVCTCAELTDWQTSSFMPESRPSQRDVKMIPIGIIHKSLAVVCFRIPSFRRAEITSPNRSWSLPCLLVAWLSRLPCHKV